MNLPEEPTEPPAAQADAGPATPDDVQQLEAEIGRTREQLGATVNQLAAKMDVKSRTRTKAADLARRASSATRAKTADLAGRAKGATGATRAKAADLAGRAKGATGGIREQANPERMRQTAAKGVSTARERPVPLAVAAVVLIAVYLAIRQLRKR